MSNPYYQAGSSYFNAPEVNELPSLPRDIKAPWQCKKCSTTNPSHQSRCQNPACGFLNLALVSQPEIRTAPLPKQEGSSPVVNDQVWTCPNQDCKYEYNMKEQAACTKCKRPKPQAQASAPSMLPQGLGLNYPSQLPNQSYLGMGGNQMNQGQYQGLYAQQETGSSADPRANPAFSSFSPSPSAGGMAGNQASTAQTESQTVEVRASIRLSKEGWVCEHCQVSNSVYLNYCSACNQFSSIYMALMQQYQGSFGSSQ